MAEQIDLSAYSLALQMNLARQITDINVLEQLAQSENAYIVINVISNSFATKELGDDIYEKWKTKEDNYSVIRELVCHPLCAITIHKIIQ